MKEQPSTYFTGYDPHYQRMGNVAWENMWARVDAKDHFKPWMRNLPKEARILDCGCGYGFQLRNLSWLGFTNLHGIELVPAMYAAAMDNLPGSIGVELADAFGWLPRHLNEFDVVIINDVLEHIPREKTLEFLKLIFDVLKPGGIIQVRVPNMGTLLASYSMYLDSTHVTGFTEYSLMQALDIVGFSDHEVTSTRLPLHLWPFYPLKIFKRAASISIYYINAIVHLFFYFIRQQFPIPSYFGMNLEVWSRKK